MSGAPRIGLVIAMILAVDACAYLAPAAAAEVSLEKEFLNALVEKLPPSPFDKKDQYHGSAHTFKLVAIDPRTRRFKVTGQVEGEYRPPVPNPLSPPAHDAPGKGARHIDGWKKFRFDVRVGVNIEAGVNGTPRFDIDVEEVKQREFEGFPGVLAKMLGRFFDDLVTRIADGKAELAGDKINAEIRKKIAAFQQYGILAGVDYAPTGIVLRFDLTRLRSQGVAGYLFAEPKPGTVPLARWLNRKRGDHRYGVNLSAAELAGYHSEGVAGYVYDHQEPNTVPLYRWKNAREVFLTTAPDGGQAPRLGYRYQGVACYLYPTEAPGTVPFYRFIDPRSKLHFYTTHPHAEFAK